MPRGSAARKLTLVSEEPPPGDFDLTREAMAQWRRGQRICRARGRHNWGPYTVYVHPTFLDVVEQCGHCRNRRSADFSLSGRKLTKWAPDYRDGYLLPRGAARIQDELHDELMLEDLLSRKTVQVDDDE